MSQWCWLDKQALLMLHDESLILHGGLPGIRDEGLLDSALSRAINLAAYTEPDFAELAATLGVELAKNHPFVDGNKRVAFLAVGVFLGINGYRLTTTQASATHVMLAVASGKIQDAAFAEWIRKNSTSR